MSFIGSKLGSKIALTGSGDRLVQAVNNNVEKWFVDKDGIPSDTPGINVKAFGAVGNGLVDDSTAIQAALDSVTTPDSEEWSNCTVYVPPGKYLLGKPLKIHKTTRLQGAGPTSTMFVNDFNVIPLIGHLWQGALIDVQDEGSGSGITTAASLVSGPGASMRIDTTTVTPIYLAPTNDVSSALDFNFNTDGSMGNGTDWTIECWFQIDPTGDGLSIGSPGGLIASLGTVPDSTFNTNMFSIAIAKTAAHTYQLNYAMQLDTGNYGGTASPVLTDGVTYHVALVYYSAGNSVTLYINGVGTSSATTPGSHVVQTPFETIQFGDKVCVFYPDGDTNANTFRGWVDGIRISSKAQYTTNFSPPTSKFTLSPSDHLVKFILNFDQFYGKSVIADGWQYGPYASPFKYYLRPRGNSLATPVGHMDFRDFGTNSGGGTSISMSACPQSVFYNLRLENANRGISINDGSFILSMDRIRIELGVGNYVWDSKSVGGREAVLSNGAVGFAEFSNFYTAGGVVGFSIVRPGLAITNWDQLGSDALIYGLIAQHADEFDDLVIDGGAIDLETATGAALKAVIKLAGVRNASIANYGFSGNPPDLHAVHCLEVLPTASPPTGSADTLSLRACTFIPNTGNTLIQINGSGKPNITLDNCRTLYGIANTLTNKPECIVALGGQWGTLGGLTAGGGIEAGSPSTLGYTSATVAIISKVRGTQTLNLLLEGTGGVGTPTMLFKHDIDSLGVAIAGNGNAGGFTLAFSAEGTGSNFIVVPTYPDANLKTHIASGAAIHLQTGDGAAYHDAIVVKGQNTTQVIGSPADSSSAIGVLINTTNSLVSSAARVLQIQNAGAVLIGVDPGGNFLPDAGDQVIDLGASGLAWSQIFVDTSITNLVQSLGSPGGNRIDLQTIDTGVEAGPAGIINLVSKLASASGKTAVTITAPTTLTGTENYFQIKGGLSSILTLDGSGLLTVPGGMSLTNTGHLTTQFIDGSPGIVIAGTGSMSMTTTAGPVGFQAATNVNLSTTAATSGSSVVAIIDTTSNWTTAGDLLLSARNNTVEKFAVSKDGAIVTGGPQYFQAAASADATISTNVDTLMTGMTLTPGAGDWLVNFSATGSPSNNGETITYSIYVNGVQASASVRTQGNQQAGVDEAFIITGVVAGAGAGQAVEVRWNCSANSATVHQRTLTLTRVA